MAGRAVHRASLSWAPAPARRPRSSWELIDLATRPRATLGRILDDLGATLTEQAVGADLQREVSSVVIHDPLDQVPYPRDAVLLGVGVAGEAAIVALLEVGRAAGASAVVVRSPVAFTATLDAAVRAAGVALLTLHRGASWTQMVTLLESLLSGAEVGNVDSETLGGLPSGDLFAVANAIESLLDAPVTIEDRNSRILAFSGRQDEADPSRIETIIGRQVPERFATFLADRGVFSELYRSQEPIFIDPMQDDDEAFIRPRVAMAVRAGNEVLGSIWAVVSGPLDADRSAAMVDASKVVALHLLRLRAGADVERRLRSDLVSTALLGGPNGADALDRLGLQGRSVCVIAVQPLDVGGPSAESIHGVERRLQLSRLSDTLGLHLSSSSPHSQATVVGEVVYGLVQAERPDRAEAIASDFAGRVAARHQMIIGVSDPSLRADTLPRARAQADRAGRALLRRNPTRSVVAHIGSVAVDAILMDLDDLAGSRDNAVRGAVAALRKHDEESNSQLLDTLAAWLDAFGDVAVAAEAVHVHPNTFRYRLRRLSEVAGIDLSDPNARFAAMLELRMHRQER